MLESTQSRTSLGRSSRVAGAVVGALTLLFAFGDATVTPNIETGPTQYFDMQAGPIEDMERYLDCLLKRLMGIPCEDDGETEDPPSPTEPVGHLA